MAEPVVLEARERRGRFGRVVRWAFWLFQVAMGLLPFGTCGLVVPYTGSEDPEVAAGAGLFAVTALGLLWVAWPVGTVVLGALLFLTRGRRRLVTLPPAATPPPQRATGGSVPPTGPPPA